MGVKHTVLPADQPLIAVFAFLAQLCAQKQQRPSYASKSKEGPLTCLQCTQINCSCRVKSYFQYIFVT